MMNAPKRECPPRGSRAERHGARRHCASIAGLAIRGLALSFALVCAEPGLAQDALRIDDFSKTLPPDELPAGWDTQKFSPRLGTGDVFFVEFVHDGTAEGHFIHVKSGTNNSFAVGSERKFKVKDWPWLEWEWRVTQLPRGGDVRIKERDDQAGAMCVIHDPGLLSAETLCYLWENKGPKGAELTSTKRDASKYIILRADDTDKLGEWHSERRNIWEDFKKLFGKEPAKDTVIGVQIDSNDTKSYAEAYYRNIVLKKS